MSLVISGGNASSPESSANDIDVGEAVKAVIDLLGSNAAYQIAFDASPGFAENIGKLINMAPKV